MVLVATSVVGGRHNFYVRYNKMPFMHQQHALREAQKVIAEWLVPDGISAEEAMAKLLPIVDNRILVCEQNLFDVPYAD